MSARSQRAARSPEVRAGFRRWAWAVAATFCLITSGAQACELALVQGPEPVRIDYNPFAPDPAAGALDVGFRNLGDTACDLRLSFTDDAGLDITGVVLGGVALEFRPRESSGLTAAPTQLGAFLFSVGGATTGLAQLDAAVVQEAVPDAGEYGIDLKLLVRDVNDQDLLAPIPVRLVLGSTPRAQLNLAGAAGVFGSGSSVEVVDFGEAVTGATRRIFVQVRANTRSTLTVKSQHGGAMQRVEAVEQPTSVPYSIELDGEPVDLSALWSKLVDPPRTLAGISLPVVFTLGTVGGQMAGQYEDLVTIDISPN